MLAFSVRHFAAAFAGFAVDTLALAGAVAAEHQRQIAVADYSAPDASAEAVDPVKAQLKAAAQYIKDYLNKEGLRYE